MNFEQLTRQVMDKLGFTLWLVDSLRLRASRKEYASVRVRRQLRDQRSAP